MKMRSSSSWATIVSVGPCAAWVVLASAEACCCPAPATKSGTSSMNDLRLEIPGLVRVSGPDASPAGDDLAPPSRAPGSSGAAQVTPRATSRPGRGR